MHKGRLEAFSDGVIAIIITIMVLELKTPDGAGIAVLNPLLPVFCCYVMSFVYVGIYWNNHHHLFQSVQRVSGPILWTNMHLLFWLSLVPFVTSWMGQNHRAAAPVALYGFVLLMAGVSYFLLTKALVAAHGRDSRVSIALGSDLKGKVSLLLYAIAIPVAFVSTFVASVIYVLVALIWVVPDRRFERVME